MSFDRTRAAGAPLTVVPRTGSTNADLLTAAPGTPHLATLVTLDQTAGRGRLDRTWAAPAGQTLAASVLVRADLDPVDRGWLPLVAGSAMRGAIAAVLPTRTVTVKWPNDVLVDGRKVCGILAQVAADGAVVLGAGVNLTIPAGELPTPTATSLLVEGAVLTGADTDTGTGTDADTGTDAGSRPVDGGDAVVLADVVLAAFWTAVREAVAALVAGGPDAQTAREAVRAACDTVGRAVRLELPDGTTAVGTATGIDDEGRLRFRNGTGDDTAVTVGDVTHLRYA